MNKPTIDIRMLVTCFSVAAITALSVWHAYHFYFDRITQPSTSVETGRIKLEPVEVKQTTGHTDTVHPAQ